MIPSWDKLPPDMRTAVVREYYDILRCKKISLIAKRIFDIVASLVLIVIVSPVLVAVAVMIKFDSEGSVFYRQERVTQYGRHFRIYKFRTMVQDADRIGSHVTVGNDPRITRVGAKIRSRRIDELPQLFNVLGGSMTFVGTRPEAVKYVEAYTDEMKATLLLPAGVTSSASIRYKDEAELLKASDDADRTYTDKVLPEKMRINCEYLRNYSFFGDIALMLRTVRSV